MYHRWAAVFAGCVVHALTLGDLLSCLIFVPSLHSTMNTTRQDLAYSYGWQMTIFLSINFILQLWEWFISVFREHPTCEEGLTNLFCRRSRISTRPTDTEKRVDILLWLVGVMFWFIGEIVSLGLDHDFVAFTGVLTGLKSVGGGMIYWMSLSHIPSIFDDNTTILGFSERLLGLGIMYLSPAVYMVLYPLYVDGLPNGDKWYEAKKNECIYGGPLLIMSVAVIFLAPLSKEIRDNLLIKQMHPLKIAIYVLASACYQAAYFIPFIQLRPIFDSVVDDTSMVVMLLGIGSIVGRLLTTLALSRFESKWWWWILFTLSAGMTTMLWVWQSATMDQVHINSAGYKTWSFFYGLTSAGIQQMMFIGSGNLMQELKRVGPAMLPEYEYSRFAPPATSDKIPRNAWTESIRIKRILALLSLGLFLGSLTSTVLIQVSFTDTHTFESGLYSACFSSGSTLFYGIFALVSHI